MAKMEMTFALQRNKDNLYLSADKTFSSRSAIHKGAYLSTDRAEVTALMKELGLDEKSCRVISFPRASTVKP